MCNYGPMMMGGGSGKIAFLLIAMALGYWVLTLADNNPNPLKTIGRIVGGIILVVSLGGLICSAVFGMCRMHQCKMPGMAMGGCPMGMAKMPCEKGSSVEEDDGDKARDPHKK